MLDGDGLPISRCRMYGAMYGMQKTTVYIPDDLKRAMARLARERGISEAELVREALQASIEAATSPRLRLPLFKSGKPGLAEDVDRALTGFGES